MQRSHKPSAAARIRAIQASRIVRKPWAQPGRPQARGVNSVSVFQAPAAKELKYADASSTMSPAVAGTGLVSGPLVGLPADATSTGRIGAQVTIKSMEWRQSCSLATTTGGGAIRTVLIYDKNPAGAAATIYGTPATDVFNSDSIRACMNLLNRDRFIVLADILVEALGTAGPQANYQKGWRKLALPQTYQGAAGAIANINQGNIFAVTWCSAGFAVAPPTVVLQTRFRYSE